MAKAVGASGGIYLDNLRFDPADKKAWTSLLTEVRKTCPDVPIVVNAGWDSDDLAWVCPLVNGIMYEDSVAHTKGKDTEGLLRPHRRLRPTLPQAAPFDQRAVRPHDR